MGEAVFLSNHHEDVQRSFYQAIPEIVIWPVFVVATLASVVGKAGTAEFPIQLETRRSIKWHTLKEGVPHLVVYSAFFYFSCSCFVIAIILNVWFLYRPILGLPRSSFKAYRNDWNGRRWAFLAGFLCGFGNGFQFMGGQAAGYVAADAVQALPLVSTFWGVCLFGTTEPGPC
ncbi:Phospholipid metabolism protein [Asimina triloba]